VCSRGNWRAVNVASGVVRISGRAGLLDRFIVRGYPFEEAAKTVS
jgi:hypothetical protein